MSLAHGRRGRAAMWAGAVAFFVFALGYPMLYVLEEATRIPAPVHALAEGQTLEAFATKHGVEAVILISYKEYRQLTAKQETLSVFFKESPLNEIALDLRRDTSGAREDPVL